MKAPANFGVLLIAVVTMIFVFIRSNQLNNELKLKKKKVKVGQEASFNEVRPRFETEQHTSKNIEENNDYKIISSQGRIDNREEKVDTIQDIEKQISENIKQVKDDVVVDVVKKDIVKVEPNIDIPEEYWFKWLDNPNMPDSGQIYQTAKERLKSRKSWMETTCRYMAKVGYSPPNTKPFKDEYKKHFMVNQSHKMLYCYIPKVANTNFRRIMLGLEGVIPKEQVPYVDGYDVYFKYDNKYNFLQEYTERQQQALLHTYIKFMAVRDPLERLLSGYRNKYFHPNPENRLEFLNKINAFYHEHAHLRHRVGIPIHEDFSNVSLEFHEFLTYFTDTYHEGAFLNEHFTLSSQLCDPCKTKINFIIKYDTLYEDVEHIFQELKIKIPFPGRNDNYYEKKTTDVEYQYYKDIPKWLLRKVWNIIKYDYVIFGFQVPKWFKELMTQ